MEKTRALVYATPGPRDDALRLFPSEHPASDLLNRSDFTFGEDVFAPDAEPGKNVERFEKFVLSLEEICRIHEKDGKVVQAHPRPVTLLNSYGGEFSDILKHESTDKRVADFPYPRDEKSRKAFAELFVTACFLDKSNGANTELWENSEGSLQKMTEKPPVGMDFFYVRRVFVDAKNVRLQYLREGDFTGRERELADFIDAYTASWIIDHVDDGIATTK